MAVMEPHIIQGTAYVNGTTSARLLAANLELSFWGGVNPKTGEVIDRFHPLSGCYLKDTILAIPAGRGSCGGSVVMMELLLNGLGPKALIFARSEEILTLGVMVTEEFFQKTAPVVTVKREDFDQLLAWNGRIIHIQGNEVSNLPLSANIANEAIMPDDDLQNLNVQLSDFDLKTLNGTYGEAARISMKIIIRTANMMGAKQLMDVSQAHVDGAWYGPGSVAFGNKLRAWGGKFRVPTTMNSINVDQKRWRSLGIGTKYGEECDQLAQDFLDMGAKASFTCAPYLLETAPKLGDAVAWGESNAVIYANSVLGARTLKNPNMLEALIALTGRAPKASVYVDEDRLASLWVRVQSIERTDDSFWPILGFSVGAVAMNHIPVISGLENLKPSKDDLKAFSAAFATSSGAPMFHMVKLTPEAPTLEAACLNGIVPEGIDLDLDKLRDCWEEFNQGSLPQQVGLVSLGNPHFSFQEIKKLAGLCHGKTKHPEVGMIITCGRSQYGLASQAGYVQQLEAFGVEFLTDTCWCSIEEPIIRKEVKAIMTNSGKYIHYGPGLTGRQFCFGSLAMCVEAACSGRTTGDAPFWLRTAADKSRRHS